MSPDPASKTSLPIARTSSRPMNTRVFTPGQPLKVGAAIIGAQKSATTSFAHALSLHPGICLAQGKESHLFDRRDVQQQGPSDADLTAAFPNRKSGQILLDATPSYQYLPGCIEALLRHEPEVKLISILRSPAARAVSHHAHERRLGFENRCLTLALASERFRLRCDTDPLAENSAHRHWSYLDRGRYESQIRRILDLTPHLLLVDFDLLVRSTSASMERVFDFLGLEAVSIPTLPRLNIGSGRRRPFGTFVAQVLANSSSKSTERLLSEIERGSM